MLGIFILTFIYSTSLLYQLALAVCDDRLCQFGSCRFGPQGYKCYCSQGFVGDNCDKGNHNYHFVYKYF